ncbi:hypothetical protein COEX109129_14915 [Corallococcus exiguus]
MFATTPTTRPPNAPLPRSMSMSSVRPSGSSPGQKRRAASALINTARPPAPRSSGSNPRPRSTGTRSASNASGVTMRMLACQGSVPGATGRSGSRTASVHRFPSMGTAFTTPATVTPGRLRSRSSSPS